MQLLSLLTGVRYLSQVVEELRKEVVNLRREIVEMREEWAVEYEPASTDTGMSEDESEDDELSQHSAPPSFQREIVDLTDEGP